MFVDLLLVLLIYGHLDRKARAFVDGCLKWMAVVAGLLLLTLAALIVCDYFFPTPPMPVPEVSLAWAFEQLADRTRVLPNPNVLILRDGNSS